ncbi:hypothetical protein SAMN05660826_02345 [Caldanaerovirga acetigignens]|uniref:Uncharacterized protein n=1 Tax=Caldanaerovirga acetigignens TaxID=447595 RepID=A0A1M7MN71_9FIRM|nr:hypothetical protein [Caldanaerovirga acetigignens]SHM91926.1 hypothetical protein SAMN05660826_02345 [Caldanaerovirga acetigignens]
MKSLFKSMCIFCISLLMVLALPVQIAKADEYAYNEAKYLQIWTYTDQGGFLWPFKQTIVARVGYHYKDNGNNFSVTKSTLDGIAVNGKNYPFDTEIVFLRYIKWYKNGSLYKELTSFTSPYPIIYDQNDVFSFGENSTSITLFQNDTWYQLGQIEVYASPTIEMWRLYNVTNYN